MSLLEKEEKEEATKFRVSRSCRKRDMKEEKKTAAKIHDVPY